NPLGGAGYPRRASLRRNRCDDTREPKNRRQYESKSRHLLPLRSLFDLDVPASERTALAGADRTGVRDFEHVRARAGLRIVFDLSLEAGRSAVWAAGARELRRRGGKFRDGSDSAIEVRAREMVHVIEMPARDARVGLRIEAEGPPTASHADLAAASHRPRWRSLG